LYYNTALQNDVLHVRLQIFIDLNIGL